MFTFQFQAGMNHKVIKGVNMNKWFVALSAVTILLGAVYKNARAQTVWFPRGDGFSSKLVCTTASGLTYQMSWKCSLDSSSGKIYVREQIAAIDTNKLRNEFEQIMFIDNDSLGKGVYLIDTASKKLAHVFPNDDLNGKNQQWKDTDSTWARFDGFGSIDTTMMDENPGDRRIKTDSLMLLSIFHIGGDFVKRMHLAKGIGPVYVKDEKNGREYRIESWRTPKEYETRNIAPLAPVSAEDPR